MKYLTIASMIFSFGLVACDSGGGGTAPPGSILAQWTIKPTSCGAEHITLIKARVLRGNETQNEATPLGCVESDKLDFPDPVTVEDGAGKIVIDPVDAGTYTLIVEGWTDPSSDPDGNPLPARAIYQAIIESVKVSSGAQTSVPEERLLLKPARLHVAWAFSDAKWCGTNETETVKVELFEGSAPVGNPQEVACSATVIDPVEGSMFDGKEGVLFDDITPEKTYGILVTGYNASSEAVREGQGDITLYAGTEKSVEVELSPL